MLFIESLGLTKEQRYKIENDFNKTASCINIKEIQNIIKTLDEDEKILFKFIYSYIPASDISSYSPDLYVRHIKEVIEIHSKVEWGNTFDAEIFLNYVLPLRINNENLESYRRDFFNEIFPRIKNLSMKEAVLEVNYWCFEKATYKSTDIRTLSPLSIIRNAYGRCGEESVLCVAALRSVGIPARQCYTPRWAHCDDNHAWVEVWINGEWHFIGACEPEPVLDKGWFAETAKRGMLIHARVFSGIISNEDITLETPVIKQINILDNYTETKVLTIFVKDNNGKPLEGADVRFELINFSQFYPLVSIKTDKNGMASLKTGYGDLNIHVSYNGRYIYKKADVNCKELIFDMSESIIEDISDMTYDHIPPVAKSVNLEYVSDEVLAKHEEKLAKAIELRKQFESTFISGDKSDIYASKFSDFKDEIALLISLSNGNHEEITKFLDKDLELLSYKVMLLSSLRPKDISDITCDILESHLSAAMVYKDNHRYDEETFVKYILCPRVYFEMISDYRQYINDYFDTEKKELFRKSPNKIYDYIVNSVEDCGNRDYETISATPKGLLELKYGSLMSRKILFVAVCRTLGIPARMSEIDQKIEYMFNNKWEIINEFGQDNSVRSCVLTLRSPNKTDIYNYEKQFTIARLEDGVYKTLGLSDIEFKDGVVNYNFEQGNYRIVTSNRLLDGSILADIIHFKLKNGENKEINIRLREPDMIKKELIEITDIPVVNNDGEKSIANIFASKGERSVLTFLGVGKEPTEHILNEIFEQKDEFVNYQKNILFILEDKNCLNDKLLKKVLECTNIPFAFSLMSEDELNSLALSVGIQNVKMPLVLGLNEEGYCVFNFYGYNVGTGDLLLSYLKKTKEII